MTKQEFIKQIPSIQKINIIFSQTTRMPMVFCHEETMDDFVYIYLEEQSAQEKVQQLNAEKSPAFVVTCREKEVLQFFGELRLTGANALCVADSGEEVLVQLTDFLRFPDIKEIPEEKRPVENTSLLLSMLYFMQELRKPVEQTEKKNLAALEEETGANLAKATFLVPVKQAEGENQRSVMLLKNEKEEVFFPLFTDAAELRKFSKGQPCQVMHAAFPAVAAFMEQGKAAGFVVNPSTVNLVLTKQGIESVKRRFLE